MVFDRGMLGMLSAACLEASRKKHQLQGGGRGEDVINITPAKKDSRYYVIRLEKSKLEHQVLSSCYVVRVPRQIKIETG